MRKLLIFTILLCITLCSCGKDDTTVGIDSSAFFTNFTAEYNDLSISGSLTSDDNSGYAISITAPENLNGLNMVYNNDKIRLSFFGLSKEFERSAIPQYNTVFTVCDVIDSVIHSSPAAEKTDDGYVLSGDINGTNYSLTLNDDRKPQILTVDGEMPITVKFSS